MQRERYFKKSNNSVKPYLKKCISNDTHQKLVSMSLLDQTGVFSLVQRCEVKNGDVLAAVPIQLKVQVWEARE